MPSITVNDIHDLWTLTSALAAPAPVVGLLASMVNALVPDAAVIIVPPPPPPPPPPTGNHMALIEIDAARAALTEGSITQPQIDRGQAAWALLVPDAVQPPGANAATFINKDVTTQGAWKGKYGKDGYAVIGDLFGYPSYAQVSIAGKADYTWDANPSDVRALQRQSAAGRIASCWYGSTFNVDINLTDGATHRIAFYLLDWDTNGRSAKVEVLDGATVLHTQTVNTYNGGVYLVYDIKGRVTLRFTNLAGYNAVLSGIFFG